MPNLIQRIRILLSSPGNLQNDRDAVWEVAGQINADSGRRDGFHIEVVSWETHTRPSVGTHPQEIINEQFPNDIDIYLGLLGTYFGTPTIKYQSGTEEEFRLAFESWEKNDFPEIMFYFSISKVDPDEIDTKQLELCKAFKREIGELGVKYEKYDDLMQFKVSFLRHLSDAVREILKKEVGSETSFGPQFEYREFLPNYERLILENPEIA